MRLCFSIFIVFLSSIALAKTSGRYPASNQLEELDTFSKGCMAELVAGNSGDACKKLEEIQRKIDSKTKEEQCARDKNRDISDLEVMDCITNFKLAKIVSDLNGQIPLSIPSPEVCKSLIRNRFCK